VTTIERLSAWKASGLITPVQHDALAAIVRKERFSVFLELSALLYLGVLFFVGGAGWTFRTYVDDLGDAAIVSMFVLAIAAAFYYCFTRAAPYSPDEVESANLVPDYVLYLGCLLLAGLAGYLEFRFEIFRNWHHHLLIGALVFGALAYRFDNRFVLSLALSSLAGWLGLRVADFDAVTSDELRFTAMLYGVFIAALGTVLYRQGIKAHFLDSYLHVAANVVLAATASGLGESSMGLAYLGILMALSAAAILLGIHFGRFAFVAYGTLYGYGGISFRLIDWFNEPLAALWYFILTGTLVVIGLVVVARRFGRDA
jgi:hypothetical protein